MSPADPSHAFFQSFEESKSQCLAILFFNSSKFQQRLGRCAMDASVPHCAMWWRKSVKVVLLSATPDLPKLKVLRGRGHPKYLSGRPKPRLQTTSGWLRCDMLCLPPTEDVRPLIIHFHCGRLQDIVVVAVLYVAHFRSALYRVAAAQHAPGNQQVIYSSHKHTQRRNIAIDWDESSHNVGADVVRSPKVVSFPFDMILSGQSTLLYEVPTRTSPGKFRAIEAYWDQKFRHPLDHHLLATEYRVPHRVPRT